MLISKWKLSFYSKPKTQLKKLWCDFKISLPIIISSGSSDSADLDLGKLKSYLVFVDTIISCSDQIIQTSNYDEISGDIPLICCELAKMSSLLSVKLKISECIGNQTNVVHASFGSHSNQINQQDEVSVVDIVGKSLDCLEILCGTSGNFRPSSHILEKVSKESAILEYLIQLCDVCPKPEYLIQVIRVLRIMFANKSNVSESMRLHAFNRIANGVLQSKSGDSAVVYHALALLKCYGDHRLERTKFKVNSSMTISIDNHSSSNIAFQLMEDLLRLAPSFWSAGYENADISGDLGGHDYEDLANIEQMLKGLPIHPEDYDSIMERALRDSYNDLIGRMSDICTKEDDLAIDVYDLDVFKTSEFSQLASIGVMNYNQTCVIDLILLAVSMGVTQQQGSDVLRTIEVVLIGNKTLITWFGNKKGYEQVSAMLIRIEANLEYLQPRMIESKAVARGYLPGAQKDSQHSIDDFNELKQNEKYYNQITAYLVNTLFDDMLLDSSMNYSTIYEWQGSVKSYRQLCVLADILLSGYYNLVIATLRSISVSLLGGNINFVFLELSGLFDVILMIMSVLSLSSCLVVQNSEGSQHIMIENGMFSKRYSLKLSDSIGSKQFELIFSACVGILQVVSTIQSNRDNSMQAFFLLNSLLIDSSKYTEFTKENERMPDTICQSVTDATNLNFSRMCQYCECDSASLECLRCAGDGLLDCFRLCNECDRVFHKASAKKGHIRMSLHPTYSMDSDHSITSYRPFSSRSILVQYLDSCARNAIEIAYALNKDHWSIESSDKYSYLKQSILISSLRSQFEDRAARNLLIPYIFSESLCLLLKRITLSDLSNNNKSRLYNRRLDIADFRDDILTSLSDISSVAFDGYEYLYPPEDASLSEKRVLSSLILQCIARCFMYSSATNSVKCRKHFLDPTYKIEKTDSDTFQTRNNYSEYSMLVSENTDSIASKRKSICLLTRCGFDSLLTILLCERTVKVANQVSSSDKQFIVWLMRELIVSCYVVDLHEDGARILSWMTWLIVDGRDDTNANTAIAEPPQITSFKRPQKVSIPLGRPFVSTSLRLMILQEILVLLTSNGIPPKVRVESSNFLTERKLTLQSSTVLSDRSKTLSNEPSTNMLSPGNLTFIGQRQAITSFYVANLLASHNLVKSALSKLGFVQWLTKVVFNQNVVNNKQLNQSENVYVFQEEINNYEIFMELQIEEWWCAISVWVSLLIDCDDAINESSQIIDKYTMVKVLLTIASEPNLRGSHSKMFTHIACALLSTGAIDRSIVGLVSISCKWPSTTEIDSSSNDTYQNTNTDFLAKILKRSRLNLSVACSNVDNDGFTIEDLGNLYPCYYLRPRTLSFIQTVMRPSYLLPFEFIKDEIRKLRCKYKLPAPSEKTANIARNGSEATWTQTIWTSIIPVTQMSGSPSLNSLNKADDRCNVEAADLMVRRRSFSQSNTTINISTHSNYFVNDVDQWEVDSNRTSTIGDGAKSSQHSYNSLMAITGSLMRQNSNETPSSSIHGDSLHSNFKSAKNGQGTTATLRPLLSRSLSFEEQDKESLERIVQKCQNLALKSSFPRCRMIDNERLSSDCYATSLLVLASLSRLRRNDLIEYIFVNLHYLMTTRMGFDPASIDFEEESHKFPQSFVQIASIVYKYMIQKHLCLYLTPCSYRSSSTDGLSSFLLQGNIFNSSEASHSTLRIRTATDVRVLLRLISSYQRNILVCSHIFEVIYRNIDMLLTASDEEICHDYILLTTYFDEVRPLQMILFRILRKVVLSRFTPTLLSKVMQMLKLSSAIVLDNLFTKIDTFADILLSSVELQHHCPTTYFHFDRHVYDGFTSLLFDAKQVNPKSEVKLSCSSGLSVVFWVKPDFVSSATMPSGIIVQLIASSDNLNSDDAAIIDVFFRSIQCERPHDDENLQKNRHITMQLCLSFSSSCGQCIGAKSISEPGLSNSQASFDKWAHLEFLNLKSSNSSCESDFENNSNLFDSSSFNLLASTISRYSLPDIIVDHEWIDTDEWSLVCLSFSDNSISCHINGTFKDLMYWTPLGYEYNKTSLDQKDGLSSGEIFKKFTEENDLKSSSVKLDAKQQREKYEDSILSSFCKPLPLRLFTAKDVVLTLHIGTPEFQMSALTILRNQLIVVYDLIKRDLESSVEHVNNTYLINIYQSLVWLLCSFLRMTCSSQLSLCQIKCLPYVIDAVNISRCYRYGPSSNFFSRDESLNALSNKIVIDPTYLNGATESCDLRSLRCSGDVVKSGQQISRLFESIDDVSPLIQVMSKDSNCLTNFLLRVYSKLQWSNDKAAIDGKLPLLAYLGYKVLINEERGNVAEEYIQILLNGICFDVDLRIDKQIKSHSVIENAFGLHLLIDYVMVCNKRHLNPICKIIERLCDICEDIPHNAAFIFKEVGVTPFFIMLSLWQIFTDEKDHSINISNSTNQKVSDRIQSIELETNVSLSIISHRLSSEKIRRDYNRKDMSSLEKNLTLEEKRLQGACARLIKILLSSVKNDTQECDPNVPWSTQDINIFASFVLICCRHAAASSTQYHELLALKKPSASDYAHVSWLKKQAALANASYLALEIIHSYILHSKYCSRSNNVFIEQIGFVLLEVFASSFGNLKAVCIEVFADALYYNCDSGTDGKLLLSLEKSNIFSMFSGNVIDIQFHSDMEERLTTDAFLNLIFRISDKPLKLQKHPSNRQEPERIDKLSVQCQATAPSPRQVKKSSVESVNSTKHVEPSFVSSSLLSFFSWGSSSNQPRSSISENSRSLMHTYEDREAVALNAFPEPSFAVIASDVANQVDDFHEAKECILDFIDPSKNPSKYDASSAESNYVSNTKHDHIDGIRIANAVSAMLQLIPYFRSPESVALFISYIERCTSGGLNSKFSSENLRSLISQPDLLTIIFEAIGKHTDKLRQMHLQDQVGTVDDSDSQSVASLIFSDTDTDVSGADSDGDTNSQNSTFQYQQFSRNLHSQAYRDEHRLSQIITQLIKLIRLLIVNDIILAPLPNRFWREIMNLPCPECSESLLIVCYDLLNCLRHYLSLPADSISNLIDNIGQMIQRVFERVEVPIEFCIKYLQAIQLFYYQCPPDIRRKLQTTPLQQLRYDLVLRIVIDRTDDISTRLSALNDIKTSLQFYLSSQSSSQNSILKSLGEGTLVSAILFNFIEVCDEFQSLANDVQGVANGLTREPSLASSPPTGVSLTPSTPKHSSQYLSQSSDQVNIVDRLQSLLETMQWTVQTIQLCVVMSSECRKLAGKLFTDLSGDVDRRCQQIFLDSITIIPMPSESLANHSYHQDDDTTITILSTLIPSRSTKLLPNRSATTSPFHPGRQFPNDYDGVVDATFDGNDISDNEVSIYSKQNVDQILNFLDWYLSSGMRFIHATLKGRITKEFKSHNKLIEKYWDRLNQSKMKYQRQSHEKNLKYQQRQQRHWKESSEKLKASNDSLESQQQKVLADWMKQLQFRLRCGKELYDSLFNN